MCAAPARRCGTPGKPSCWKTCFEPPGECSRVSRSPGTPPWPRSRRKRRGCCGSTRCPTTSRTGYGRSSTSLISFGMTPRKSPGIRAIFTTAWRPSGRSSTSARTSAARTTCCRSWRATGRACSTRSPAPSPAITSTCRRPGSTPWVIARKTCSWSRARRSRIPRPCCSWSRICSRGLLFSRQLLPRKQRFVEAEAGEVADPHRVEDAVEVVAFVLHHPGVKTLHLAFEKVSYFVKPLVAQRAPARHPAAHPRHREATFPGFLHFGRELLEHRVDQHGIGHFLRVRVARVGMHSENDDAQPGADLRRGEAGAIQVRHGVAQVLQQLCQLRRPELFYWDGNLPQPRVSHAQHFADHCRQSLSMMLRTRPIASSSTAPMRSSGTARRLSPRPAA